MYTCEKAIEQIMNSLLGDSPTLQEMYFLRELLRSLVRMARAEQTAELKNAVLMLQEDNLGDCVSREQSRRITKRLISDLQSKQIRINFEQQGD